ncbi:MAG: hypothetical protein V1853_04675 [bacterium]
MNRKLIIAIVIVVSIVSTVGIVKAAGMTTDWLRVGIQGVGGVTYFNGTIINETTDADGNGNPVAFGDNIRVDGRLWRGIDQGTSDSLPFIIDDNAEITGTLTAGNITATGFTGSGIVSSDNLASNAITSVKIANGTIVAEDLADAGVTGAKIASGSVTQTEESGTISDQTTIKTGTNYDTAETITMTTGDSNLFCMFSGYGTNDTADNDLTIGLSLDDEIAVQTVRRATIGGGNGFVNLVTNAIMEVEAGEHTISLLWNASAGTTGTLHVNTLDCIELKK